MPQITNPHVQPSRFSAGESLAVPAYPITDPQTDLGKEGLAVVQEARKATQRLREIRDEHADAIRQAQLARAAYEAEVARQAREGERDADKLHALSIEVEARIREADEHTFRIAREQALSVQRAASTRASVWVWERWPELLTDELADDAHEVAEELQDALAKIEPMRQRYHEVARKVSDLVGIALHGPHADELAARLALPAEPAAPLPDAEQIEIFQRARTEPTADEVEHGFKGREVQPEQPIRTHAFTGRG